MSHVGELNRAWPNVCLGQVKGKFCKYTRVSSWTFWTWPRPGSLYFCLSAIFSRSTLQHVLGNTTKWENQHETQQRWVLHQQMVGYTLYILMTLSCSIAELILKALFMFLMCWFAPSLYLWYIDTIQWLSRGDELLNETLTGCIIDTKWLLSGFTYEILFGSNY